MELETMYRLGVLGNALMEALREEWCEVVSRNDSDFDEYRDSFALVDGVGGVGLLAILYVTATAQDAYDSVVERVAECVRNDSWRYKGV